MPNDIAELTMYQFRMMVCDIKELGGVVRMSPEEARAWRQKHAKRLAQSGKKPRR